MTWQGHPRTTTPLWRATRRRILDRDGHACTICGTAANEVDHIIPHANGGTDEDHNLRTLCPTHHRAKSSQEGNTARWRNAQRKPEAHPGMR